MGLVVTCHTQFMWSRLLHEKDINLEVLGLGPLSDSVDVGAGSITFFR